MLIVQMTTFRKGLITSQDWRQLARHHDAYLRQHQASGSDNSRQFLGMLASQITAGELSEEVQVTLQGLKAAPTFLRL